MKMILLCGGGGKRLWPISNNVHSKQVAQLFDDGNGNYRSMLEHAISEIREIDPSITSLSDLTKMPNYQRFYDLVKRGNTLTDAFRLVNMDRQTSQVREQAQQAALNKVASKSHLDRTTTRGAGAVTVPADVMEQFRIFNPDATDEEIRKYWAKSQKK